MLLIAAGGPAETKRKVILDQDAMGPAGTDQNALLVFLQSPDVETLGITVVTGDGWRDEEVAHTLRMLEIIGRTDIPVVPGAAFPLVNTKARVENWEKQYGRIDWKGAWTTDFPGLKYHEPSVIPPLLEGSPATKAAQEDAAHFLVRMVRRYPHEITIYEAGPMTDVALAMELDPQFPELAKELAFMGGSLNPSTNDPEFVNNPRHEFNFWFDAEATHKVLHGHWKKITATTVDVSLKTHVTKALLEEIGKTRTPVAQYVSKYTYLDDKNYMWDELAAAAWLDPSIITREETIYMDADIEQGAGYGNTLTWVPGSNPGTGEQLVHVQLDLNPEKLYRFVARLMTAPTPDAHFASPEQR